VAGLGDCDRIGTAFGWPRSFAFARRERED
jgi:hypothetical protein